MKSHTITIADNQFLTREGLKHLIASKNAFGLVDSTPQTYSGLLESLQLTGSDILIIDYLFDTFSNKRWQQVISKFPVNNILVITNDENKDRIDFIVKSGINNFITKNCNEQETWQAIEAVGNQQRYFCNNIMDLLLKKSANEVQEDKLSRRELEVLTLVAKGFSTNQIAQNLHLSVHTINSHRKNMLRKLNLKSPTELVVYALESGLIKY